MNKEAYKRQLEVEIKKAAKTSDFKGLINRTFDFFMPQIQDKTKMISDSMNFVQSQMLEIKKDYLELSNLVDRIRAACPEGIDESDPRIDANFQRLQIIEELFKNLSKACE